MTSETPPPALITARGRGDAGGMAKEIPWAKRLKIVRFQVGVGPSVRQFCACEQISLASFHRIRATAQAEGLHAVQAKSRAPREPARCYTPDTWQKVVDLHDALTQEGLDAGAITLHFHLTREENLAGGQVPSVSTIQRILKRSGRVKANKRKRPRSSYKRFEREKVNDLWQIDGVDWASPQDGPCCIYQVIDDASRLLPALLAYPGGESTAGARAALEWGFSHYGIPQEVLSDNGSAFNSHRQGRLSQTERWLASLGVLPSSGHVGKPTTQGKDERSHQPMESWLDHHPTTTLQELNATLEDFRCYYNDKRPHQAHTPVMTPREAWEMKPHAEPTHEPIDPELLLNPLPPSVVTTTNSGVIRFQGHMIYLGRAHAGRRITLTQTPLHQLRIQEMTTQTTLAVLSWPPTTAYVTLHPEAPRSQKS